MDSQQIRRFDMLRRVQQYLDDSAAKLPGVSAMAARKELDVIVQEMAGSEAAQATNTAIARGETAVQEQLRRNLWKHHMLPVATIARAHLRTVPEFTAMQLPHYRAKAAQVVQAAVAMADVARVHRQVFLDNGRPENFVDALIAAAAAMRASIDERARSLGGKVAARKGLKTVSQRANEVVRLLDAQVKSLLVDDPKALAAWNSAKRIGKGRVVPKEGTPQGAQTPELEAASVSGE